jgi:hypothetical protein
VARRLKLDAKTGQPLPVLDNLPLDEGLRFGDWAVWRDDRLADHYLYVIHRPTGRVVHVVTVSNGWLNYRTEAGTWYVVWTSGSSDPQDRGDLQVERYLRRRPAHELGADIFTAGEWSMEVNRRRLTMTYRPARVRLAFERRSPRWTWNGRHLPEV